MLIRIASILQYVKISAKRYHINKEHIMSKYLKIIPFAFLFLLFVNCNKSKDSNVQKQIDVEATKINYTASNHPGKKLMENKCYVCHNPSTGHDGRIAPPMVAIKSHYLDDETTKKEFKTAIWNFVEKPSVEKTKMRGAVKRFGVMPYQPFSEEEINLISDYMYDFEIDEPEWFKEHIEEESNGKMKHRNDGKKDNSSAGVDVEHSRSMKAKTPADRGQEYALNTKKELGKNLMGTIQKKETLEAVTFCNKQAYPITDSMAVAQNASIRRVSDKPRNPENQDGSMTEKDLGIKMPIFLGAGAEFIPISNKDFFLENEIVNLNSLKQEKTLIGYIYGGIESSKENIFFRNNGTQSIASNQAFKVYLTK